MNTMSDLSCNRWWSFLHEISRYPLCINMIITDLVSYVKDYGELQNHVCAVDRKKKNEWWMYDPQKHKWCVDKEATRFMQKVYAFLHDEMKSACHVLMSHLAINEDDGLYQTIQKLIPSIHFILQNIETPRFMNTLICKLQYECMDASIFEKMDNDLTLLGFENGVWDSKMHKFRPGRADDFITMSTRLHFYVLPDMEMRKHVEQYFSTLFPDDRERSQFLCMISSQLGSPDIIKKIYLHKSNRPSSGRKTFFNLLSRVLGEYCCEISVLQKQKRYEARLKCLEKGSNARIAFFIHQERQLVLNKEIWKDIMSLRKIVLFHPHIILDCDRPQFNPYSWHLTSIIRAITYPSSFIENNENVDSTTYTYKECGNKLEELSELEKFKVEFFRYLMEHNDANFNFAREIS